ncbi:prealbumin-like fold domain-containing protein [Streptococcus sp. 263_SSPC]|uniref:prealbumin-like fold domain-containing protein n=1 Tax=Streptococcus sp. 263_SSPC TaxID=1579343 RepID=UPI000660296F|nr:prealbumin-like fold domain-containing protein [Streptococcus sp. 263_SSPC]
MKIKSKWFGLFATLLMILSLVFFGNTSAKAAEAKELQNVISGLELLDQSDTKLSPDANGVYQILTNRAYKLRAVFDLEHYNGDIQNGDFFKLEVPAEITFYDNHDVELVDLATNVPIADAHFEGHGDNQGGTITVTLKNLDQYLAAKGADTVKEVKGTLALNFLYKKNVSNQPVTFDSPSLQTTIIQTYNVQTLSEETDPIGKENFAKIGGQAANKAWTSAKLEAAGSKASGQYVSEWKVRVNTSGENLGDNLVLTDTLPSDPTTASIQYIPESLVVYNAPSMTESTSGKAADFVQLVEGTDYTVNWNSNYTNFTITFKDGSKKYYVTYDTTTPNDGSKVQNMVSVAKADGTLVTRRTNTTETTFTASATSLFSGTIEASSAYTVKVSKVDEKTLNPVAGAVYVITDPDGNTVEVTTDAEGHAVSPQFDEKYAGKEFKIKEKTAPEGYELDETEYTVTLGQDRSILHVKDTPKEEETTTTTRTTTTEETTVTTVEETSTTITEELPNTGTGNQTIYMVIGALLVVAAVGVLVFAKKKDSDEDK